MMPASHSRPAANDRDCFFFLRLMRVYWWECVNTCDSYQKTPAYIPCTGRFCTAGFSVSSSYWKDLLYKTFAYKTLNMENLVVHEPLVQRHWHKKPLRTKSVREGFLRRVNMKNLPVHTWHKKPCCTKTRRTKPFTKIRWAVPKL